MGRNFVVLFVVMSLVGMGSQPAQGMGSHEVSASGEYVAFSSCRDDLVAQDLNQQCDIFVLNRTSNELQLASLAWDGAQANRSVGLPSMPSDGRKVAFQSYADNLVPNDSAGWGDMFVRDLVSDTTQRVSVSSSEAPANGDSFYPDFSDDGRFVAFTGCGNNLVANDTNAACDVFVRDLVNGTTARVSLSSSGQQANNRSSEAAISGNGQFVAFTSSASNLVVGDSNGEPDLFVRDRVSGQTTLISVSSSGVQGNVQAAAHVSISADGRYVAFLSESPLLVPGDTNNNTDVFVHDRVSHTTTRASVSTSGQQGSAATHPVGVSSSGPKVTFVSGSNQLTPGDVNGQADIFVRDLAASTTTLVSTSTSGQRSDAFSSQPSVSDNGAFVAFDSLSALDCGPNVGADSFLRDLNAGTTVRISRPPENLPPYARISVSPTLGDTSTLFEASLEGSCDPDHGAVSYFIDWGDGTTAQSVQANHSYEHEGDYTVTARITDQTGLVGTAETIVRVCVATNSGQCLAGPPSPCSVADCEGDVPNVCAVNSLPCSWSDSLGNSADEGTADGRDMVPVSSDTPNIESPLCPEASLDPSIGACVRAVPFDEFPGSISDPLDAQYQQIAAKDSYCAEQTNRNRWMVFYAYIGKGNDRLSQERDHIRASARQADQYLYRSGKENGGIARHLRFDCESASIAIKSIRLSRSSSEDGSDPYERAIEEAMNEFETTTPYKRNQSLRRFVLFMDWSDPTSTDQRALCGGGQVSPWDTAPGRSNVNNNAGRIAAVYMKPGLCYQAQGDALLHEIGHTLGAILDGSPNNNGRGHVNDRYDALAHGGQVVPACSATRFKTQLDCRGDDYFNTKIDLPVRGTWLADRDEYRDGTCEATKKADHPDRWCHWNTAWSAWLVRGGGP